MSRMYPTALFALPLAFAMACGVMGCAGTTSGNDTTTPTQQEQKADTNDKTKDKGTDDTKTDDTQTDDTGSDNTDSKSYGVYINLPDDSILRFDDSEASAKLVSDMETAHVPTACHVMYDQMGALPNVDVTDPKTIAQIYKLVARIKVVGPSEWSITDNYHYVIFDLQDGTSVGFRFEGEGLLVGSETNYEVTDDGKLWAYVRKLQNNLIEDETYKDAEDVYAIKVTGEDDLVSECPRYAKAGETVTVNVAIVLDADAVIKVDGEVLQPVRYDGAAIYEFTMPDHDVTVEASLQAIPGGS